VIHIFENNLDFYLDKINWYFLSQNPDAIHILEKNLDKIDWYGLSLNSNAIHILEKNLDKVNWDALYCNPSIFQIDYGVMRENGKKMAEEIAKIVWHPSRMARWPEDCLSDDLCMFSKVHAEENITCTIRKIKMSIKIRS
jgi:hypothetical protein